MTVSVYIEKTELAKELETKFGIDFSLAQNHILDAGYDVRACIDKVIFILPGYRHLVPTGLKFKLSPENYEIQVRPRSGLAAKNGIMVVNSPGTVDAGYRDEVQIILYNSGGEVFNIKPGDRIAQLCFREIPHVALFSVTELPEGADRRGGFGSSGI